MELENIETSEGRRVIAQPKPPRGARRQELLDKRRERRLAEDRAMEQARIRDKRQCRVPGCRFQREGWALHVAHLEHRGMGGNPSVDRSELHKLIALCARHHQGPGSLDAGELRIEPETDRGTNGPVNFLIADEQAGWISVGVG